MEIRLDQDSVEIGNPLAGVVRLGAEAARCTELAVQFVRTITVDGRTRVDSREVLRTSRAVPSSAVEAEARFTVDTGNESPTYDGRLWSVEHAVIARAEIEGDQAAAARKPVLLSAPPTAVRLPKARDATSRNVAVAGLVMVLYGAALIIASRAALEPTLAGLGGILVGAVLVVPEVRRRRWGKVVIALQPSRVEPGSDITVAVDLRPWRASVVRRVEAAIEAEEVADAPGADGETPLRQPVFASLTTLFSGERSLSAGTPFRLAGSLRVPPDARPTVRCKVGAIEWQVRVRLEGDGTPVEEAFPVVVTRPLSRS